MKKTFLKFMPLAAAVLFATSCSKNDDNGGAADIVEQPSTTEPEQPAEEMGGGYVKVPFSVKVDNGTGLSKISYEAKDGSSTKVTRKFVDGDKETKLTVTSVGGKSAYAIQPSTLTLASDDDINFYFTGEISVLSDSLDRFNGSSVDDSPITLTGVFGTAISDVINSTTSLADLMNNCNHQYKGVFLSYQTDAIQFIDQNAYLAVALPVKESSVRINNTDYSLNCGRCWIAFDPTDTKITSEALGLSEKVATAGTVYTVYRKAFSVSATKKVHFAPGNLQYNASASPKWRFADNQYDYVGGTVSGQHVGNVKVGETVCTNNDLTGPWIDLFGWVGASSTWTDAAMYGVTTSYDTDAANGYGTGTESLKSDWGKVFGDDSPWRTLTGGDDGEWKYLLDTRGGEGKVRYAKAQVAGVNGLIIVPDDWKNESPYNLASCNTANAAYTSNVIPSDSWDSWETAGAVFLPAAGSRAGSSVSNAGSYGYYWSSTSPYKLGAYDVLFYSDDLSPVEGNYRYRGYSVRLVRGL